MPDTKQCWASLVAQTVKNLSAMQETQVRSLGQEDPLEKEMATYASWVVEVSQLMFITMKMPGFTCSPAS